ncbi:MAG: hypothetical protein ACOC6D_06100 [Atribacterota bacterium]
MGLIFSLGFFNTHSEAKFVEDKTPEEYYHIKDRIVRGGEKAINIGGLIGSIASIARKHCKDELDEDGNVVEEGYFRYHATTNYFRVEVDDQSGYARGKGRVVIHYEKKCPGYLPAKAFKNSGNIVAEISAKGKVGGNGIINGTAWINIKVPTRIGFSMNFTDSWTAQYTQSFIGPSKFSVDINRFDVHADFPITVPAGIVESPQLIGFEIEKQEAKPTILGLDKPEMIADGEDSQTITVAMEQKAILKNSNNGDTIDDSYEGGVKDEEFVIQTRVKPAEIGGKKSEYKHHEKLVESACDNSSCDSVVLTTNKQGRASFVYTPPKIEDKEFLGATVIIQAIHDQARPEAKIQIDPVSGLIEGELVNINGRRFDSEVKARLVYPSGVNEKPEDKTIKANKGDFSFETKSPLRGYKLILAPKCEGCKRRTYVNLPYIIDLGDVLLGTIDDYEQGVKNDIKNLFKGSGMEELLGDFLNGISFNYDGEGPYYSGETVYLPSENFMMDANDPQTMETVYHEIFHGIHSKLAEHGWIHTHFKLGGEHQIWEESSERVAWDEALSHFFPRLLMMSKGIGYESEDYSKRSIDSDNINDNGNLVEGKVTGFLVDYYKYKNYSPQQILGDLYHTLRSYQDIDVILHKERPAQTIAEWILTKLYMDPTDYTINALMNKHNIALDTVENIDWGKMTIVKSEMKGRRAKAEREKAIKEKAKTVSSGETKRHTVDKKGVGKNTTYKAKQNTTYVVENNGQCELDRGTVVARNGGAVNTQEARVLPQGTVYSVTALDDKTVIKAAKGEVIVMNTSTWKSYIAEAGEEVEVYEDKIEPVAYFDPKADPDFERNFMDFVYEYFSWMNLLILVGAIVILIVILIIIKKIIKKK